VASASHLASVENGHTLVVDRPDRVETLFDAQHQILLQFEGACPTMMAAMFESRLLTFGP